MSSVLITGIRRFDETFWGIYLNTLINFFCFTIAGVLTLGFANGDALSAPIAYTGWTTLPNQAIKLETRISLWSSLYLTSHDEPFPNDPLDRLKLRTSGVVAFILRGNSGIERFTAFYPNINWNRQTGAFLLSEAPIRSQLVHPTIRLQPSSNGNLIGTVDSVAAPQSLLAIELNVSHARPSLSDSYGEAIGGLYHASCPLTVAPGQRVLARYFRIVPVRRFPNADNLPKYFDLLWRYFRSAGSWTDVPKALASIVLKQSGIAMERNSKN